MSDWTLIAAAVSGILIVVGLIIALILRKKKFQGNSEPDYFSFFIIGICFIPLGLVFMLTLNNLGFIAVSALGVIYLILGLKNKSKWKK